MLLLVLLALTHLWYPISCQVSCAVPAAAHALRQVAPAAAAWQRHGVLVCWWCGTAVLVLPLQRLYMIAQDNTHTDTS